MEQIATFENPSCRICGDQHCSRSFVADEIIFGLKEQFDYFECARCGCVQIKVIPDNLGNYYPKSYYSFEQPRIKHYPSFINTLRFARSRARLGYLGHFGRLLAMLGQTNEHFSWLAPTGVDLDSRILDVGCGSGRLVAKLARDGFSQLTGIDPFMTDEMHYPGVRLIRSSLDTMSHEEFDLIMLHHSLEHMPNPLNALRQATQLLAPSGTVLIRVPLADSYAFRKYGTRWVGFDAPRHLYLFTVFSISLLAQQAGLTIGKIAYDSTVKQFHSELANRGIPIRDLDAFRPGTARQLFTRSEWKRLKAEANRLNTLRDGDTACFFLQRDVT